jgi:hypothetical protein
VASEVVLYFEGKSEENYFWMLKHMKEGTIQKQSRYSWYILAEKNDRIAKLQ